MAWRSLGIETGTLAALRAGNGAVVAVTPAPLAVPSRSRVTAPRTDAERWGGLVRGRRTRGAALCVDGQDVEG